MSTSFSAGAVEVYFTPAMRSTLSSPATPTPHSLARWILLLWLCSAGAVGAIEKIVLVGGNGPLPWRGGGGTIPATAILDEATVDETNTPGGVIDFEAAEFPGWILPHSVDTSDNILIRLTSKARGGTISSPIPSAQVRFKDEYRKMIDGDGETALEVRATSSASSAGALGLILEFDFNALFAVNRIRFFPRNAAPDWPAPNFPFQNDFLKGYEIFINDGRPESLLNGRPIWTTIALEGQNEEAVVDLAIPTQFVRRMRLKSLTSADFEIAEIQVFAEGFVPQATYLSNVFDFGEPALLGHLRWIQQTVGDSVLADVLIRTRTGVDPEPAEYTRTGVQSVGLAEVSRTVGGISNLEEIFVNVPWKEPDDVDDDELRSLVETKLEDELLSGAEALLAWSRLPLNLRAQLEITGSEHGRVRDKGPIRDDLTNWSPWSPPYSAAGLVADRELDVPGAGTPVRSPSPRRYFQFMVEFASRGFDSAAGLGALAFDVSTPALADTLIGEVFPRNAEVGATTDFTYAVLVRMGAATAGFDRLEIETPLRVEAVGVVEIQGPDGPLASADFSGHALDDLPVEVGDGFAVLAVTDDGLLLSLPTVEQDEALVTVEFATAVLRFGTIFSARVLRTDVGAVGQNVLAGNAADLGRAGVPDPDLVRVGAAVATNLTVQVAISRDLLTNVRAAPGVFTPNGDQRNDRVAIHYDVTNIASPVPVEIQLFDLAGRPIRTLVESRTSGRYAIEWDGRDDAGRLVPPGQYVYAVTLDADTGEDRRLGVIGVAY